MSFFGPRQKDDDDDRYIELKQDKNLDDARYERDLANQFSSEDAADLTGDDPDWAADTYDAIEQDEAD